MNPPVKSRIWISNGTTYNFPEQQLPEVMAKPPVGLCFSGGGARSMTATMGQLRALTALGLMPNVRYISCVSGGSWATTIYSYYCAGAADDAQLLGPVTPPAHITGDHVENGLQNTQLSHGVTRSFEDALAKWGVGDLLDKNYTGHDVWIYAVGHTYLADFGLFSRDEPVAFKGGKLVYFDPATLPYFSYDQTTVDEIKACNPALADKTFVTLRPGRPFPVINSCVLLPQNDPKPEGLINFEYTPLTAGRAHLANYNGVNYGGGFIEPFAYRSIQASAVSAPEGCNARALGSAGYVTASGQDRPFSLTETTGTSSSAFSEALADRGEGKYDPQVNYWAIGGNGPYSGAPTVFGDAGLLENYGLIPLIQRGVELAIVFINTDTKLDPGYVPSNDPSNSPGGRCDSYLPALFGYSNSQWSAKQGQQPLYYPNNQVFPCADLIALLDAFNLRRQNGEPMIVSCQHQVLANDSWGVQARKEPMTVVWCYLDRCEQWEEQLGSPDIRKQIEEGNQPSPTGDFRYFPNYRTAHEDGEGVENFRLAQLTPQQITLLADFTCGCVMGDSANTIANAIAQIALKR